MKEWKDVWLAEKDALDKYQEQIRFEKESLKGSKYGDGKSVE